MTIKTLAKNKYIMIESNVNHLKDILDIHTILDHISNKEDIILELPITIRCFKIPDILSTILSTNSINYYKSIILNELFREDVFPSSTKYLSLYNKSYKDAIDFLLSKFNTNKQITKQQKIYLQQQASNYSSLFLPSNILSMSIITLKLKTLINTFYRILKSPYLNHDIFKPIYDDILRIIEFFLGYIPDLRKFKLNDDFPVRSDNLFIYMSKINQSTRIFIDDNMSTKKREYERNNKFDEFPMPMIISNDIFELELPYSIIRHLVSFDSLFVIYKQIGNGFMHNEHTLKYNYELSEINNNDKLQSILFPLGRTFKTILAAPVKTYIEIVEKFSNKSYPPEIRYISKSISDSMEKVFNIKTGVMDNSPLQPSLNSISI